MGKAGCRRVERWPAESDGLRVKPWLAWTSPESLVKASVFSELLRVALMPQKENTSKRLSVLPGTQ